MKVEVEAYKVISPFVLDGREWQPGEYFHHSDWVFDERATALRRGPTFVKRWQVRDVNTEDEMIDMEQYQVLPVDLEGDDDDGEGEI